MCVCIPGVKENREKLGMCAERNDDWEYKVQEKVFISIHEQVG